MPGYDFVLQLMKYGFSALLLLISVYGYYSVFKKSFSPRALISWPAVFASVLVLVGIILLFSDTKSHRDFLNLVKIISGVFTVIYGIYATLSDFYEENEEGRRVITRIGLIGIILFFFSALLSVGADYIKRGIEKQALEERRQYLEKIVDKLVVVDKKSGKLGLNLQKFTSTLLNEVKQAGKEMRGLRVQLADREARIVVLEKQIKEAARKQQASEKRGRELNRSNAAVQGVLKERTRALSIREKALRELDGRFAARGNSLRTAEKSLAQSRQTAAAGEKKLIATRSALAAEKDRGTRTRTELDLLKKNLSETTGRLTSARKALNEIGKNLAARTSTLASREKELNGVRKRLTELRGLVKKREALLQSERKRYADQAAKLEKRIAELNKAQGKAMEILRKLEKSSASKKPAAPPARK